MLISFVTPLLHWHLREPTPSRIRYPYGLSLQIYFYVNVHHRDRFVRLLIGPPTLKGSFGTDMSRVQCPFLTGQSLSSGGGTEGGMQCADSPCGDWESHDELLMIYTWAARAFGFIFSTLVYI